jgi:DNA-binding NarL/FixJ family response regulator
MDGALKVLLADDHPLILQGLRRTLEGRDDIQVVGEARSGAEVLALVERRQPDVVLLDLRMPDGDGLETIREIRRTRPEIKTVILSACEDRPSIDAALNAGANAYIIKSVHGVDLPPVLHQVSDGGAIFHAPAPSPATGDESVVEDGPGLTTRELTILAAVVRGLTTKAISSELWLSDHTVKFHLTNIYRKLGVANRSGAVRRAYELGLVPAEEPGIVSEA